MCPYLYIGTFEIPVYGLIIIFAYVTGLLLCARIGKNYGIAGKYILCSGTFAAAGMLLGSKLLYAATRLPSLTASLRDNLSAVEIIQSLFGGYVFYGGLIGGVLGVIIFCHVFRFDKISMLNALTPLIPFGQAFGRIGCFFGGCCYGIEYHGPFAVQFPYNPLSPSLHTVPRFPVQLAESLLCFILFAVLYFLAAKKSPIKGTSFGIYLICYSIIRFSLEFLRGDSIRGIWSGLSTSQWISLILLPLGIAFIFYCRSYYCRSRHS